MPALASIVIPALHRPELTAACLTSVRSQTIPQGKLQIIVVEDDARGGPTLANPEAFGAEQILLEKNYGFAAAANRGIERAEAEFILLLNNDVELRADYIPLLIEALQQDPKAAFATGKLLNYSDPGRLDGAWDALLRGGAAYRIGHGDADHPQFEQPKSVLACGGAALLLRKSALNEIGGLDEDFFAYLEDIDLCLRARQRGYHGIYVPSAVAVHRGGATLGAATPGAATPGAATAGEAMHPRVVEWITRNQLLMVVKNYPAGVLLRTLPQRFVYQWLWLARTISMRRFSAYLRGMLGIPPRLPGAFRKRWQIMRTRRISSAEFLNALKESERQVAEWQGSLPPAQRSRLLKIYFQLFRQRQSNS